MGTLFGSFYTLAVYRIPNKIDITHTHSFCPKCGHKLGFFELIPVWSYIFLGAKCKNCKEKIRPRYFILEILSGIVFIVIAFCLKIDAYNLNQRTLIKFGFIVLYLVGMFIIAGIDLEYRKIEKSVLYYSFWASSIYIIYLCIMGHSSIYRYVMYLVTLIILLIIDSEIQIKQARVSYLFQVLMLIVVMLINTGELVTVTSIIIVFMAIAIVRSYYYLKNYFNKSKKVHKNMLEIYKFGYLFTITNIMLFISQLYLVNH